MKRTLLLFALSALLCGCGGGFPSASTGGPTPTPAPGGPTPPPGSSGGRLDLSNGAPPGAIYFRTNYGNSASGVGYQLYAVRSDGSGRVLVASAASSGLYFRALSPDGKNLVYGVSYGDGKGVFLAKADGGGARTLAPEGFLADLTFTPDGQKLVYSLSSTSGNSQDALVENLDGGGKRTVATGTYDRKTRPGIALSPDGTKLAATGDAGLIVESLDGGGRVTLVGADAFGFVGAPVFSPDGAMVAANLVHRTDASKSGIYVLGASGPISQGNAAILLPDTAGASLEGWTAAGILYYNSTSRLGSGSQKGSFSWFAADPGGGGTRAIAAWEPLQSYDLITTLGYGELSPDKTQLAYAASDGQLYRVSVAGGAPQKLTDTTKSSNWNPTFNADGTKIAFVSSRDARGSVDGFDGGGPSGTAYVMNADGSGQTRLIDGYSTDYPATFRNVKLGGAR